QSDPGAIRPREQLAIGSSPFHQQHASGGNNRGVGHTGRAARAGEDTMNTPSQSRGLTIYAFAYLAFLYIPVLLLPLFSFNDSVFIAFPLRGFTTKWYAAMAADTDIYAAL